MNFTQKYPNMLAVKLGDNASNPTRYLEHNYAIKLERMRQAGRFATFGVRELKISHDDWCGFLKGGRCDCDPHIVFLPRRSDKDEGQKV